MKVCRGLQCSGSRRIGSILLHHAGTRKGVSFDAQALAIEEQFYRVTVGKAGYGNILSFLARPIPVRKEMEHGFGGPSTLIEVVGILGKSACIQGSTGAQRGRPARLPQIIDAGPDKVTADVIVGLDEFL